MGRQSRRNSIKVDLEDSVCTWQIFLNPKSRFDTWAVKMVTVGSRKVFQDGRLQALQGKEALRASMVEVVVAFLSSFDWPPDSIIGGNQTFCVFLPTKWNEQARNSLMLSFPSQVHHLLSPICTNGRCHTGHCSRWTRWPHAWSYQANNNLIFLNFGQQQFDESHNQLTASHLKERKQKGFVDRDIMI